MHGDGGAFPEFDIVLPDDSEVRVVSCEAGFYLEGSSRETSEHELVDLLKVCRHITWTFSLLMGQRYPNAAMS